MDQGAETDDRDFRLADSPERNDDKKPVEEGFEFQKFWNFATCLSELFVTLFKAIS